MVEIGMHWPQWSQRAGFSVIHGVKFSLCFVHLNTKIGCLAVPNHNCSTLTVPMSHCMYIKWEAWMNLEYFVCNGLHGLAFQSEIEPHIYTFQHQDWVPWSPQNITAAPWLFQFQCLIVWIPNGKAWLRLECIDHNGLNGLAFQSSMGWNSAFVLYI